MRIGDAASGSRVDGERTAPNPAPFPSPSPLPGIRPLVRFFETHAWTWDSGESVGPAQRSPAPGAPSVAHFRAVGHARRLQGVVPRVPKANVGDALDDHKVGR